jgi:hypothetical protein
MKEVSLRIKDFEGLFFKDRREPVIYLGDKSYKAFIWQLDKINRKTKKK